MKTCNGCKYLGRDSSSVYMDGSTVYICNLGKKMRRDDTIGTYMGCKSEPIPTPNWCLKEEKDENL